MKRLRKFGEISVHSSQGGKPLDAFDLRPQTSLHEKDSWSIEPHGLRNTLKKLFPCNIFCCNIQKCNLKLHYKGGSHVSTLQRSTAEVSGHKANPAQIDRKIVDTCSVIRGVHVSAAYRKKNGMNDLHLCKIAIDAEIHILEFWRDIC